jgi:CubicO group peptidase (beta-lactamase class C family)
MRLFTIDLPKEMFKYSNTGYIILAELVEKISGKSFELFCDKEIFSPLGMDDTYFINENIPVPNDIAFGHTLDGELFEYDIRTCGDGGIITTVDDMLIWDNSMYSDPVVSLEALEIMMSPLSDMKNGVYYGYGFIIDNFNGYELPSGNGGYAGIFAYSGRNKEKKFYVCLMGNSPNYSLFEELISTVLNHYLQ